MRSSLLSRVRQITSSRQSPRMSARQAGVALVPLFDVQPSAVEQRVERLRLPVPLGDAVAVEQLAEQVAVPPDGEVAASRGLASPIFSPLAFQSRSMPAPAAQHSAPGWRGSMSNATPRPGPSPLSPPLSRPSPTASCTAACRCAHRAGSRRCVVEALLDVEHLQPGIGRDRGRRRASRRRGRARSSTAPCRRRR